MCHLDAVFDHCLTNKKADPFMVGNFIDYQCSVRET